MTDAIRSDALKAHSRDGAEAERRAVEEEDRRLAAERKKIARDGPKLTGEKLAARLHATWRRPPGIHIPSKLAYGANPPEGAPIPPNADLEFDIHVVQIVPNAASMMQGQPQQ
jgi:hypothetical protein